MPAPGIAAQDFSSFVGLRNAGAERVSIESYVRPPNTVAGNDLGYWVGTTKADIQPLVITGQPATGFPQGWSYYGAPWPVFNAAGTAAVAADVRGPFQTTPQPHYPSDFAVYTGTRQDNLQPIFKLGSGSTEDKLHLFGLTSSGRLLATDSQGSLALRIGQPGDLPMVEFHGQPAYLSAAESSVSVAGERYVASLAPFGPGGQKVITGTNANDAVLLASGNALPGAPAGGIIENSMVHLDPSGRVTFAADLGGPAFIVQGLWQGTSSADLHLITITGQPAVGTNDTLSVVRTPAMNDLGQVAYIGDLTFNGAPDGAGMFAYDPAAGLRLIARTGDTVQIGPGDVRTIASLVHPSVGGAPTLSDTWALLFRVDFTDGSSGLMLADVPEPAAALIALLFILCLPRPDDVAKRG